MSPAKKVLEELVRKWKGIAPELSTRQKVILWSAFLTNKSLLWGGDMWYQATHRILRLAELESLSRAGYVVGFLSISDDPEQRHLKAFQITAQGRTVGRQLAERGQNGRVSSES